MNIEWKTEPYTSWGGVPSQIAYESGEVCALIFRDERSMWQVVFIVDIHRHLGPLETRLKTEAGIRRRVEKYITLWVIAGRPT